MEFLRVENLCKVYGQEGNQVTAVDHVTLSVNKGDRKSVV